MAEDGIEGRGTDQALDDLLAEIKALSIEYPTWSAIREKMDESVKSFLGLH